MSTSSINSLSNSYLQSIPTPSQNSASTTGASLLTQSQDQTTLSPLAQVLTTLQQLQQSNPAEYQQVTQQISANLQTAAQTAQSQGNTPAANQLNQLANDFSGTSTNGQLPNIQDLAQAIGGHHHHHHAHAGSSESANSNNNNNNSDLLTPATIILNTLSNAGSTTSGT